MDNIYNMKTVYYFDNETPIFISKEYTINNIINTIRENLTDQYYFIFGNKAEEKIISMLVNGFILFNSYKHKKMLINKQELVKYVSNNSISFDERYYFIEIYLYFQRPSFLTKEEHEYLREKGNLDEYNL